MKLLTRKEKRSNKAKARAEAKLTALFDVSLDDLGTSKGGDGGKPGEGSANPNANANASASAADAGVAPGGKVAGAPIAQPRRGSKNVRITGRAKRRLTRKAELAEAVADMTGVRLDKLEAKRSRKERLKHLY
eukprot:TRINITY_DN2909_c2_g1_i1.p3 TRINITY_DN2909_c2_g1~~TRINITY_DN2909_c2_g1_i1.p3  ORF type:complete len:133 (-),score=65.24 TRINITY_DN2909_c2_g1_i1:63-461(-)